MNRYMTLEGATSSDWLDRVAVRVLRTAASSAPRALSDRLQEEWLAALAEQPGGLARLRFACGCWWAALMIARDHATVSLPLTAAVAAGPVPARTYRPPAGLTLSMAAATRDDVLCEINTTPLIDVMLVLLVTLIITLPVMTHAVKIDLPHAPPAQEQKAEVIDLDIDFDGTVVWNGSPVAGTDQLESYFREAARRVPQPEFHVRADRRAKYDYVARVLALAQKSRVRSIGLADTGEFKD